MPEYFTLVELRAQPDLDDTARFTDTRCEAVAAHIVSIIEREVSTSFVSRTVTDEPHDGGGNSILLRKGHVLSVTSAKEDTVTVTDTLIVRNGVLLRISGNATVTWKTGYNNVLVTYASGYSATPPADVKEMALKGTRAHLLSTAADVGINDRRTSMSTDMGVIQFTVAGENRPTGYPEVDAMILGWKARLDILGFA